MGIRELVDSHMAFTIQFEFYQLQI